MSAMSDEITRLRQVFSQQNLTPEERKAVRFCVTASLPETEKLGGVAGELCRMHGATLLALLERLKDTPAALDTPSKGSVQNECAITDSERSAITEASEFYIGTRTGLALSGLLSRTGTNSRQTGDNAAKCTDQERKTPEREHRND
jgi:hypothetical protein